ncbi:hypothetical protein [Solibacillus sp. CAU 1738]|uniref:tetratricopeptide repeat protein n=1 Tax=Solibacillus sp. CAU 1738 TaxID=3140363 RepID=UPI0032619D3D
MKKKHSIKKFENVVMFPGTVERLLTQAHTYAENYQYDLANEAFAEALKYTEGDEMTLSVYAYSLYEARAYEQAKVICEELLALGPVMYFEAMELYLTISMQLREFKQVEKIIETLLDEGAIPDEQLEKFQRLKNLNSEIAQNKLVQQQSHEEIDVDVLSLAHFLSLTPNEQLVIVHELTTANVRPVAEQLKAIVEHEDTNMFIQSLILILLVEQEVSMLVTVKKFEREMTINPAELELPTKMPQFQQVSSFIIEALEQEPSTLEMVEFLISKHAIVTYPFEWLDFDAEDVATSYIDYVRMMFGKVQEMDYEIIGFLQQLEELTELQQM